MFLVAWPAAVPIHAHATSTLNRDDSLFLLFGTWQRPLCCTGRLAGSQSGVNMPRAGTPGFLDGRASRTRSRSAAPRCCYSWLPSTKPLLIWEGGPSRSRIGCRLWSNVLVLLLLGAETCILGIILLPASICLSNRWRALMASTASRSCHVGRTAALH